MHLLVDLFFVLFCFQRNKQSKNGFTNRIFYEFVFYIQYCKNPRYYKVSSTVSIATYKVCGMGKRDIWS